MSFSRSPYQPDGSALVYAGESAVMLLALQNADCHGVFANEDLTTRVFVQRVVDRAGQVLLQAAGEIETDDGQTFARFTLAAADLTDLLGEAYAVDLKWVLFEALDDGGKDWLLTPAAFSIRAVDDPTYSTPSGPSGLDAPAALFIIRQSPDYPRFAVVQRGGRGQPGNADAAGVPFDNTASGIAATNVQDALDWLLSNVEAGTLDGSLSGQSGLMGGAL